MLLALNLHPVVKKKRTHVEMRVPHGPQLQVELNVIASYFISYGFSGAAVLIHPGSARIPHNWMKVKHYQYDSMPEAVSQSIMQYS